MRKWTLIFNCFTWRGAKLCSWYRLKHVWEVFTIVFDHLRLIDPCIFFNIASFIIVMLLLLVPTQI